MTRPRNVEIELSIGKVLFRLPNEVDLWALFGSLPRLDLPGEGDAQRSQSEAIADGIAAVELADRLLVRCAKRPRMTTESIVSDEALCDVADLTGLERVETMNALLKAAGHSREEAERIGPLSEIATASTFSTR